MAEQPERITWPVPQGFPDMSEPVKPGTRFNPEDISIKPATEEDLLDLVRYFLAAPTFRKIWRRNGVRDSFLSKVDQQTWKAFHLISMGGGTV